MTKEELIDLISTDHGFENYLNSVRAEGVEMAVGELKELAKRSEAEAPNASEHTHASALYLMLFAAQLRAGEPS